MPVPRRMLRIFFSIAMVKKNGLQPATLGFTRWRWGILAALAMTLLAVFPQFYLWYERGSNWQGAHAYFYTDETAYAAYINALIDGRPRRCDPYTGYDATRSAPLPESLFSIQFIPAYMIALPARVLGLSTASMFILLAPLVAFVASLGVFRLFVLFTDDHRSSAAFVPFVLCLGILLTGNGVVRALLNQQTAYVYLPFLRRYSPAVPFCFFLFFFVFSWQSLIRDTHRQSLTSALAAAACLVVCVYGYFYLWTAAAAWLFLVAGLWLIARPDRWRKALLSIGVIGLLAFFASVPYAIMLSRRAATIDVVQALTLTHAPDLGRSVEFCALIVLVALATGIQRRAILLREPRTLLAATFALLPFVLFNQQIVTGRSLQPMHYEQFIAPYTTLIAAAITMFLLWEGRASKRRLPWHFVLVVFLLAYCWGAGETWIATRRFAAANVARDEARAVGLRLREIALKGYDETTGQPTLRQAVVFAPDIPRADNLPMVAPQPVLWAPHMFVFSGVTVAENKERFFQYLYYSGVGADDFIGTYQRRGMVEFAIFGWERANPRLTINHKPITEEDLQVEARNYTNYISHFDRSRAEQPMLSYVLLSPDQKINFVHLDRWYVRDQGERIGRYLLYRVSLRP